MVDKITINPTEVRGLGDIIIPKTTEDFTEYMSSLTETAGLYTLTYDETGTYLTLSASPTTISYGSSTVFTAVLIQSGEPVEGETVSFYEGETLLGTDTTDSNGEATLTKSDFTVGSHSVKAVYDEVESSAVTVTVNKLTSTITLSVPASGTVGTSYTVSGTLVPTSGSVKLYENGSLKDTLTVSSGTFSKVITQSNEGTYSYYAVFEGSSTYDSVTSSTGSIVVSDVPAPVPASVDLTATSSILSYADGDTTVLTATVLDSNDDPVENVSVELYKAGVLWDTLTTDSSGEVSKTYTSAGVGDVSFEAKCNLVTETYSIEDCDYYADTTKISNWSNVSSGGTAFKKSTYAIGLDSYSVEMKFNTINAQVMVGNEANWVGGVSFTSPNYLYTHSSNGGTVTTTLSNPVASDIWRIEVEGTTIRLYRNDALHTTKTNCKVDYPKTLRLYPQDKSSSITYVKVKPL